jgi:hypothetical protein
VKVAVFQYKEQPLKLRPSKILYKTSAPRGLAYASAMLSQVATVAAGFDVESSFLIIGQTWIMSLLAQRPGVYKHVFAAAIRSGKAETFGSIRTAFTVAQWPLFLGWLPRMRRVG